MVRIILVGFLPDNHRHSCKAHPYGCGNALIEGEGNDVGRLVCLCLVEKVHLACYLIKIDEMDGSHVCFFTRNYAVGKLCVCLMVRC
jgi:hypothetical protein